MNACDSRNFMTYAKLMRMQESSGSVVDLKGENATGSSDSGEYRLAEGSNYGSSSAGTWMRGSRL